MADVIYRSSATAPIPSATTVKNSPLTNAEGDGNMRSIVTDLATKVNTTQLNTSIQSVADNAIAMAIALG